MHPLIDPAGIRFAAARLDARHCHALIIGAGRGQTHIWCLRRTGTNSGARPLSGYEPFRSSIGRIASGSAARGFFEDNHLAATARARPGEVGEVAAWVGEAVEGWPAPTTGARQLWTLSAAAHKESQSDGCAQSRAATRAAEPAQEFVGRHGHCALLVDGSVVLPLELSGTVAWQMGLNLVSARAKAGHAATLCKAEPAKTSQQGAARASPAVFLCSFSVEEKLPRRQGKGSWLRCPPIISGNAVHNPLFKRGSTRATARDVEPPR
jgi:hypothetical protein